MPRPQTTFSDLEHLAAQVLSAALWEPFAAETTCIPALVTDTPVGGSTGRSFPLTDRTVVSLGPQQSAHLADVGASVVPRVGDVRAAAFVMPLQIASATVAPPAGSAPVPTEPLVLRLLPYRMARTVPPQEGSGAIGCVLVDRGGQQATVVVPIDVPRSAISALDDAGWVAPDVAPSVLQRVVGLDLDVPVPVGPLYVSGWVSRVLAAVETHGPYSAQAQRAAERPPRRETVERMTAEKLLAAATGGRVPSPLDPSTLRWAGPGLAAVLLAGVYGSLDQQLSRLAELSEPLAAQVAATCRTSFGLPPD